MKTKHFIQRMLIDMLCILMIASCGTVSAFADTYPCLLRIEYLNLSSPLPGVTFRAYYVAEMPHNREYLLTEKFAEANVNLKAKMTNSEWLQTERALSAYRRVRGIIPDYVGHTDMRGVLEFKNIPPGLYLVEGDAAVINQTVFVPQTLCVVVPDRDENNNPVYDVTVTPKFEIRNIPIPPPPKEGLGNLIVMKTVSENGDRTCDWHFTVTLDRPLTGQFGDIYFENGTAEFTLKHGESLVAKDIPVNTGYKVIEKEADSDGYVTSSIGETGIIYDKETAFADFVNTKEPLFGNLEISKVVTGYGNKGRLWHFTVTLDTPLTGQYGDIFFENGVAVITLKHGETKTARKLPENVSYTVKETDANEEGYISTSTGAIGTIPGNGTAFARFVNHLENELESENPKTGDFSNNNFRFFFIAIATGIICIVICICKTRRKV